MAFEHMRERDKINNPGVRLVAPDVVFLTRQLKDTEFSPLGKTWSEADLNLAAGQEAWKGGQML